MLKKKFFPKTTLPISQECFQTLLEVSEAFPFCGQNQKLNKELRSPDTAQHTLHPLLLLLISQFYPACAPGPPTPWSNCKLRVSILTPPYLNPELLCSTLYSGYLDTYLFSPVASATKSNGISW